MCSSRMVRVVENTVHGPRKGFQLWCADVSAVTMIPKVSRCVCCLLVNLFEFLLPRYALQCHCRNDLSRARQQAISGHAIAENPRTNVYIIPFPGGGSPVGCPWSRRGSNVVGAWRTHTLARWLLLIAHWSTHGWA